MLTSSRTCTPAASSGPSFFPDIARGVFLLCLGALAAAACSVPSDVGVPEYGHAGLLVIHGDREVFSTCVSFSGAEITGAELLERSGVEIIMDPTNPMGVLVCSVDQEGCLYPEEKCLCECGVPGRCTYWGYFTLGQDGQWGYSPQGAAGRRVTDGDVDAWVWMKSAGAQDVRVLGLPDVRFDEICGE